MNVSVIKTEKLSPPGMKLFALLDRYVKKFSEGSVLAITSKVVSICEGAVRKIGSVDKEQLIAEEADYFLPRHHNLYKICLTIKNDILIPTAGIDESNGNGYYILWPSQPQRTANAIRRYLQKRFGRSNVGVIITDSRTVPLRWGTSGVSLAHSGFKALKNYIGLPDLFGRIMQVSKSNIVDSLAVAAVLSMGEGSEQTPIALLTDLPFVEFVNGNPSQAEITELHVGMADDLYAPLFKHVQWKRGTQTPVEHFKKM